MSEWREGSSSLGAPGDTEYPQGYARSKEAWALAPQTAPSIRDSVRSALRLLSRRDRRLLGAAIAIQMATSLLDLIGVVLMGLVAALAVTVVQSQPPPLLVERVTDLLGLNGRSAQELVVIFGLAAAFVLLLKSVVSSYLLRRVLRFLANRQALISARLTSELMSRPLTEIQERPSQETAYALMGGAGAATVGLLGSLVIFATEMTLLVVLAIALMFVDPLVTVGAIVFFALVAYAIQRPLGGWAGRLGRLAALTDIASLNAIQEALAAYREITVSHRRDLYAQRVQNLRWTAASVAADGAFIGQVPKYVFEAALVIGGFALAGVLFLTKDAVAAVGTLAVFLAAASRVMPSLLRLQGATLALRGFSGSAQPTFALADWLGHPTRDTSAPTAVEQIREQVARGHSDFRASVEVRSVTFTYPGTTKPAIEDISLTVEHGMSAALVGRSGSGKSTLADVILGILKPEQGVVLIGQSRPNDAVSRWPGGIAYVPQEIVLANDTVRANVALGLPQDAIDDSLVWDALGRVHLDGFLRTQRNGLDTQIGESGLKLSGGQRQRLGLARALFTRPRLLVLDEATSALDAETEVEIAATINSLANEVTTIIIAHRLSTIRAVDEIIYLEQGRLRARGSFDQVRGNVPEFARQARLLGM
jgi:ABC-type multidrug transport system fused ATPase/permease subunit